MRNLAARAAMMAKSVSHTLLKGIISNGSQYVDLGYDSRTEFVTCEVLGEVKIRASTLGVKNAVMYGARSTSTAYGSWILQSDTDGGARIARWGAASSSGKAQGFSHFTNGRVYVGDVVSFTLGQTRATSNIYVNGVEDYYEGSFGDPITTSYILPCNVYLFKLNGTSWTILPSQLNYLKLRNGSNIIRSYLPVIKDGVVCFYEEISGVYLYNSGSGNFGYEAMDGTIVNPT